MKKPEYGSYAKELSWPTVNVDSGNGAAKDSTDPESEKLTVMPAGKRAAAKIARREDARGCKLNKNFVYNKQKIFFRVRRRS